SVIVGSGWTMAMGLSPSAIASPELTVDKSAKPIAPSPSDTALTSSPVTTTKPAVTSAQTSTQSAVVQSPPKPQLALRPPSAPVITQPKPTPPNSAESKEETAIADSVQKAHKAQPLSPTLSTQDPTPQSSLAAPTLVRSQPAVASQTIAPPQTPTPSLHSRAVGPIASETQVSINPAELDELEPAQATVGFPSVQKNTKLKPLKSTAPSQTVLPRSAVAIASDTQTLTHPSELDELEPAQSTLKAHPRPALTSIHLHESVLVASQHLTQSYLTGSIAPSHTTLQSSRGIETHIDRATKHVKPQSWVLRSVSAETFVKTASLQEQTELKPFKSVLAASQYLTASSLTGAIAQALPAPQTPQDFETPDSNEDRFLQPDEEEPQPFVPDEDPLDHDASPTTPGPSAPQPAPGTIRVETLTVKGSSILSEAEINQLGQAFVGQSVSEDSLQRLADAITEKYLERGYITSRAILNPKTLPTGQIEIQVLEGGIEEIEVEGLRHLNTSYIRSRIALGAQTPLNTGALEDQLRLLRSSPLVDNIEASLRSGTQPAKSILVVRVTEAERFRASSSVDNYSPPSVGSERLSFSAGYQNLTGIGDDLSVGFKHTAQAGSDTLDFTYRAPLNPMDGTLQFRTSFNRNNVVQEPFSVLDIRGNSQLYELSFRQPLQRNPREEFALSAGLTYQTGQTFTFAGGTPFGFGPEPDGTTTTTVLKLGQDYIKRDPQGAWALRSQFSIGLDLLSPTINSGSTPDSRFVSWLGQIQRVQVLNENNFLIVSTDLQLASEPLLSSQQFVIGGGQSVRGFRQNVRAGDGGLRFSVEDRMTLSRDEAGRPTVILVPFFDMGWIWYDSDNPNRPTNQQDFIAGTGLGVILTPFTGVTLRFDYAIPLVDLSDRTQNAQDDGIHFSVNVQI
ncbi:MAG: BamA/TamA family outer membrane protein, partial [Spirulina sp. SIO3F2]|nr:BamA/TamA family outer membrane protein [Spirulina sp. SIO3F2]